MQTAETVYQQLLPVMAAIMPMLLPAWALPSMVRVKLVHLASAGTSSIRTRSSPAKERERERERRHHFLIDSTAPPRNNSHAPQSQGRRWNSPEVLVIPRAQIRRPSHSLS